ncbi:hypothetical protein [uncultured Empedobacter sp.]|uniref:hypothetical protein n=1 Tax=uncultured Empedobacter sp. TaxID=410844 RepID=UPI0025D82471|nr:hypothetical protein [uncultured Empedobacter sp.]
MGFSFNISFGGNQREPLSIDADNSGNIFYTMFSSSSALGKVIPDADKLRIVLNNPALLKVIALDCDIFSLGKINKYQDEKIKEVDFLYSETNKPNMFQSWTQFDYDYKFWLNIFGTAYLYNPNNSKVLNENSNIQWLNPCNFQWESGLVQKLQALILSKQSYNDIFKNSVLYRFDNGDSKWIKLTEITPFHDLTNAGSNNPMKGYSRIDALYKVIKNSELALDAKSINLEFAQKYLVAGQADPDNVSQMPMSEPEKLSIEEKLRSNKKVHAIKSMIDIKRFVEDIGKLKIDESFYNDYFMFGTMFNIPRDILEANLRGSTYENQEKSMARLIEYCEAPKGQMLTDWLENQYGYQDIRMSWSHLMFNQVFEKERAERVGLQIDNIIKVKDSGGITVAEANKKMSELLN